MSKTLQPHSTRGDGVTVIVELANIGILQAAGTTVPSDGAVGYAPSCTFHHIDGGDGTAFYINEGTRVSADFNAVNPS